jgi:protein SCO1
VAFFGENPSNQLIQQFSRVEKLASDDVKVEALKGENVEKDATEIYKIKPLIKAKSAENILYNEQFILIDKEGYTRGVYDGTDPEDVDRLLAELKILIDIYNKGKD